VTEGNEGRDKANVHVIHPGDSLSHNKTPALCHIITAVAKPLDTRPFSSCPFFNGLVRRGGSKSHLPNSQKVVMTKTATAVTYTSILPKI
jgi:hypothetical protein